MRTRSSKRIIIDSDEDLPLASSIPHIGSSRRSRKTRKVAQAQPDDSERTQTSSSSSSMARRTMGQAGPATHPCNLSGTPPVNPSLQPSSLPSNFFRSPVFESRFHNSILHNQCIYEKFVDQIIYNNSPLLVLFDSCGLSAVLFPPTVVYPRLVQQFYANFELRNHTCTSLVKGQTLSFSATELGTILSVPSTGCCPFTLKGALNFPYSVLEQIQTVMDNTSLTDIFNPKTVDVSPLACVLHKLIRFNLVPRLGGGADFTFQDLIISALIMKGQSFNFAQLMLYHMDSCIRQVKKCIPYSALLTTVFNHFHIPLENESSVSVSESLDPTFLKQAKISLVDGTFIRIPSAVPPPSPSHLPSTSAPPSTNASPEILTLLNTILSNQQTMQKDISSIQDRLSVLEKGKLSVSSDQLQQLSHRVEDEFIDLQAGFELHTTAMVEALERKLNRNACQLSQEIKFVSNQVGELSAFSSSRFNDIASEMAFSRRSSPVSEWPECNWLAEYRGDFLDMPLPDNTFIPRPPKFASEHSLAEKLQRVRHRRYFTQRRATPVVIQDLD